MSARYLTWMGETLSMSAWARRYGLSLSGLSRRLRGGMTIKDALLTPKQPSREKVIVTESGPMTAKRLARIANIAPNTIHTRLRRGFAPDALAQPSLTFCLISAFGKAQTSRQWAQETGLNARTIRGRIWDGWTPEDAVSLPRCTIRAARRVTAFGKSLTLAQWSDEMGIGGPTLKHRLDVCGMPPEAALTLPVATTRRRKAKP